MPLYITRVYSVLDYCADSNSYLNRINLAYPVSIVVGPRWLVARARATGAARGTTEEKQ